MDANIMELTSHDSEERNSHSTVSKQNPNISAYPHIRA